MISGAWDYLEQLTNGRNYYIKRNDPTSWSNINTLSLYHNKLVHWNAGHAKFLWDLRQNYKITSLFKTLNNSSDILVSFDSFSLGAKGISVDYDTVLYYNDCFSNKDIGAYNSILSAFDNGPSGDVLFTFYENSHKNFYDLQKQFTFRRDKDGCLKDNDLLNYLNNRYKLISLYFPRNSLVLWDKRLIRGLKYRSVFKENHLYAYISFDKNINIGSEKQKMLMQMITTNSSPYDTVGFDTLPKHHTSLEKYVNKLDDISLKDIGMKMCGFTVEELELYESYNTEKIKK